MKYRWLREEATAEQFGQIVGIPVKSLKRGMIPTGETYIEDNGDGTTSVLPVLEEGVEIEFEQEPATEQLEELDGIFYFQKLKREGGRTVRQDIEAIKARLDALEVKVTP